MEFLLNCIQPFICQQWLLCFLKNRRLGVKEVLEVLNWLGSGPWCWSLPHPWPTFCARPRSTSTMECWVSMSWAIISTRVGCDGGGRSSFPLPRPSLPPALSPPAPLRVRVICKVATISDYWLMPGDCRWIRYSCQTEITVEISQKHNKNRGITIHSRNMTSPILPLIVLITHAI